MKPLPLHLAELPPAATQPNAVVPYLSSYGGECSEASDCDSSAPCIRAVCMQSNTFYHEAYSLAFEVTSDGFWTIVDATQSTWTESVYVMASCCSEWFRWDAPWVRIFMMDSPASDVVLFIFGILNVLASMGAVWFLRSFLTKRFKAI